MEVTEWKSELLRLTPSILYNFVLKPRWGMEAYYRRLYGKQKPATKEMIEGTQLHESLGYDNKIKFRKKFTLKPYNSLIIELSGVPDKIDENGRPWEAKTVDGMDFPYTKLKAAKIQLLSYLFLMDKDFGYVDFISRKTKQSLTGFPKHVLRNDPLLFLTIRDFIRTLYSQQQLTSFIGDNHAIDNS